MTENRESTIIGFDVAKRLLCNSFLSLVHAKPRYFFLELRPDSIFSNTWLIQLLPFWWCEGDQPHLEIHSSFTRGIAATPINITRRMAMAI